MTTPSQLQSLPTLQQVKVGGRSKYLKISTDQQRVWLFSDDMILIEGWEDYQCADCAQFPLGRLNHTLGSCNWKTLDSYYY